MGSTSWDTRADRHALTPEESLRRLGRSRVGYLACSERALPTVVPVSLKVVAGRILLELPDARTADYLVGQVVALGVGVPARLFRSGWSVVARGMLQMPPNASRYSANSDMVLEPSELEGHRLHHQW